MEQEKKKNKHYGWIIFIGIILFLALLGQCSQEIRETTPTKNTPKEDTVKEFDVCVMSRVYIEKRLRVNEPKPVRVFDGR